MLHVILTILIVLGIIIAVVLGIIILLLAAVLFVPVRYRVKAQYYDGMTADIRIHWLFHILNGRLRYTSDDFVMRLRILWIRLYDNHKEDKPKRNKKRYRNKSKKNKNKEKYSDKKSDSIQTNESNKTTITNKSNETTGSNDNHIVRDSENDKRESNEIKYKSTEEHEDFGNYNESNQNYNKKQNSNKWNPFLRIKLLFIKIKNIILNLCDKIRTVWHRLKSSLISWRESLSKINNMIHDEKNLEFINLLKSELKSLIKYIRPTKYRVYAKFGSEDPETVGQVTAVVALFCGLTGMNISFVPVFEQEAFEGEIFLKGRIRLYRLAIIALRLYRNEVFKKLI